MSAPEAPNAGRPLRILILSWRDPKNPKAGGAELFTHEVARRLVAGGDEVEWFVAGFPGASREESLDGVRVVRRGLQWTVHLEAVRRYRSRLQGRYDAVIDEINTIPFFTPLWADIPRILLIFQLAREVWWYESRLPLNAVGYMVEPAYLRLYRRTPTMTISASTEQDLRALGFVGPISILPIGLEPIDIPNVAKEAQTTFLYVGRMAPSKRVHDIIAAFALVKRRDPQARLWLVGDGTSSYVSSLKSQAATLRISTSVEFLGRLPTAQKHERMAKAWVLLMASVREGWGLSIAEAGACGTPSVVYDVPGLRDAVRNRETGLVVQSTPAALAHGIAELARDRDLYARLTEGARRLSATFSFDATADALRATIVSTIRDTIEKVHGISRLPRLR